MKTEKTIHQLLVEFKSSCMKLGFNAEVVLSENNGNDVAISAETFKEFYDREINQMYDTLGIPRIDPVKHVPHQYDLQTLSNSLASAKSTIDNQSMAIKHVIENKAKYSRFTIKTFEDGSVFCSVN